MSMFHKKYEIRKFNERHSYKQEVGEISLTQQNMAADTDINNILAKYRSTGVLTHVAKYAGQYGDFSAVPDYQPGLEMVIAAEDMFMSLPSSIRDRFHNDPAQFIDFATDEKNIDELRSMGLAPKKAKAVEERPQLETKAVADPPKEAPKPE